MPPPLTTTPTEDEAGAPPLPHPGNPSAPWRLQASASEHHRKPLFCVAFNHCDPRNQDLFASVGANRATVYRARPDGAIEVVQTYADADETEEFFACQWSATLPDDYDDDHDDAAGEENGAHNNSDNEAAEENDPGAASGEHQQPRQPQPQQPRRPPQQQPPPPPKEGRPLLLAAGRNGVVRVIDVLSDRLVASLRGHGRDVHDVAVHPRLPHLALTASRDHSVRLWNLKTGVCAVVVAGVHAHTNEVFSLSWHPWDPYRFMSSGMDSCVKVWSLRGEAWAAVEASGRWRPGHRAFPAVSLRRPLLSASQVHGDYVDCVRWLGDLALSKSVHGFIAMWKPVYGPAMAAAAAAGDGEGEEQQERDDDGDDDEAAAADQSGSRQVGAAAAAAATGAAATTTATTPPGSSVAPTEVIGGRGEGDDDGGGGGDGDEAAGGAAATAAADSKDAPSSRRPASGAATTTSHPPPPHPPPPPRRRRTAAATPPTSAGKRRPLDPPPLASADVDGDCGGYALARLFPIDTGHMWWVRFGLDGRGSTLACGGAAGTVHVWDPRQARVGGGGGGGGTAAPKSSVLRTTVKGGGAASAPSVVRQAAVSLDGSTVIAGCEDGSVWRWGRAYAPGLLPGAEPVTALARAASARGGATGAGGGAAAASGDGDGDRMSE